MITRYRMDLDLSTYPAPATMKVTPLHKLLRQEEADQPFVSMWYVGRKDLPVVSKVGAIYQMDSPGAVTLRRAIVSSTVVSSKPATGELAWPSDLSNQRESECTRPSYALPDVQKNVALLLDSEAEEICYQSDSPTKRI